MTPINVVHILSICFQSFNNTDTILNSKAIFTIMQLVDMLIYHIYHIYVVYVDVVQELSL